jgi:membrane protein required for colicin V production
MSDLPVNAADLFVAVVLVLSCLVALVRGFTREVLSIVGWVGAALATIYGFGYARVYARTLIESEVIADIAAGVALFLVSLIILSILAQSIGGRIANSRLSALDRTLGLLFGLARGALFVVLAYLALGWVMPPTDQPAWLKEARTRPLVEAGAEWLKSLAPATFRNGGQAALDEAGRRARQAEDFARALGTLGTPGAKPGAPGEESGYKNDERRGLDQLIESNQDGSRQTPK